MRFALTSMLCALFGCAHYTVTPTAEHVAVTTVSTPAHLHIDEAQLTRSLVDELRARGFDATWSSVSDVRLVCALDADSAFESSEGAMTSMRGYCDLATAGQTHAIQAEAQHVVAGDRTHANNATALAVARLLAREFERTMRDAR